MYVVSLSNITKTKCRICLDDGTEFVLPVRDVSRYGLREGEEVDPQMKEALWKELRSKSVIKCGRLLQDMDYSRQGLMRKLRDAGFPEDIVLETTQRMQEAHYVDDARYAEHYVRVHLKDRSLRKIQMDLRQKGLLEEDIQNAVDIFHADGYELNEEDNPVELMEAAQIRKLMDKYDFHPETASWEEKAKFAARLMRRGYQEGIIHRLMKP